MGLDFLWASFLDVDFTDADVIFVCSVLFSIEMLAKLALIARWMKPGSRIVSHQPFVGCEFKTLGQFNTPTTWEASTCWTVQEVIANPPADVEKPDGIKRLDEFYAPQRRTFIEPSN